MNKREIIVSPHSGFCFGVKRALDIANKALKTKKRIYSIGPIIHNPQVAESFARKGLRIIHDIEDLKGKASVLIPSHGVSPVLLKGKNITYIDTTCPLVGKVHKIVRDLRKKGFFVIIAGDKKHPEVKALLGVAGEKACVVKDKKEAGSLASRLKEDKVALISQTTASLSDFEEILSELKKNTFKTFTRFNTVCKNTMDRQKIARKIARRVEVMIVIGGKNSANTARLAIACKSVNKNTYHVENAMDLRERFLRNRRKIGIAAGASTPPEAISEIIERIRRFDN